MTQDTEPVSSEDIGAYCREVEAHLCRVNGGHLVRIVGPAFMLVTGWATEGIPLRIVLHGGDRTVTRLTAKGPRRRPVRIEFCEADVRDAYDQWRRAVGVRAAEAQAAAPIAATTVPQPRVPSLPRHIERVLVRLSANVATRELPASLRQALETTIRDVDACLDQSRAARGDARSAILARLVEIEHAMTEAAIVAVAAGRRADLRDQVSRELSPYKGQMPPGPFAEAEATLLGDLVRRHFLLPQVRLDG
jgi:hypothetical protein